jgi:hypothetical protein
MTHQVLKPMGRKTKRCHFRAVGVRARVPCDLALEDVINQWS